MPEDSDLTSYDSIELEDYLDHIERPTSWNNLYERPQMLSLLPPMDGKNVLDIGCASGYYTEYALNEGATVSAVDISRKMINELDSHVKSPKLSLYRADVSLPMPFLKSDSFDCVICSLMLHYIKEWEAPLGELYRVLKKGGRLVISTHHPFSIYIYIKSKSYFDFKLVEDTWGSKGPHPFKVHYYYRPLKDILRPIINSKFRIVSIDEPLPDDRCRELAPEIYSQLNERPGFLFIVLEK
jgi:ubiquinone/menaquinone biosynthesis C-methylase UbiE